MAEAATAESQEVSFKRKITVKEVCGKPQLEDIVEKKKYALMRVFGHAHRVKLGSTDMGEYQKLLGQFEAINLLTGEVFQAPQCIMPEPGNGMIAEQLLGENPADSVSFALEIGVQRDESSAVGYVYWTKPLLKAKEADPLSDLRSEVKALEAPKEPASASKSDKKK